MEYNSIRIPEYTFRGAVFRFLPDFFSSYFKVISRAAMQPRHPFLSVNSEELTFFRNFNKWTILYARYQRDHREHHKTLASLSFLDFTMTCFIIFKKSPVIKRHLKLLLGVLNCIWDFCFFSRISKLCRLQTQIFHALFSSYHCVHKGTVQDSAWQMTTLSL